MRRSVIDGRRVDFRNGLIILPKTPLIVNLNVPSEADLITENSTQLYPVGTQLRKLDSLWRYCKAGAAIAAAKRGFLRCNYAYTPGKAGNSTNNGFEGAINANVVAGAVSFVIADTAAVVNEYENASLVIYDDTNERWQDYVITKNDVSTGSLTTCYIASPGFKNAVTTSMGITIYLNPYRDVRDWADGSGWVSALGYAKLGVTNAYWFWLQTAGRLSGITGGATWPGQTSLNRTVYAQSDGALVGSDGNAAILHWQRVGFLLGRTATDYGDNFIHLELDH
ncbi:hypothetical protein LCGC14_0782070 [marine sediment metagenome]|uniref:Uncharacterized protein n=1 Tax=marine sediment metagenome TaxID=412755 RepID=A0A0F9QF17_9ZZZZ